MQLAGAQQMQLKRGARNPLASWRRPLRAASVSRRRGVGERWRRL